MTDRSSEILNNPSGLDDLIARDAQDEALSLISAGSFSTAPRPVRTIAFFYYRAYNGGIEMVMSRLSAFFAKAGYHIVLITDFPPTPEDYPFPENTRRFVLPDTFQLTPETRVARFHEFRRVLREASADVLIHNAWLSFNLLWDLLAVKTAGIPYIQYIHGAFSCQFTEGQPREMDQLYTLTRILPLADHIVSLSKTFDRFWGKINPHTTALLNPCPPARPEDGAADPDPNMLLWVGRISPEKQPAEAVRILHEVRKQIPGVRLKIVGGTDPACRPCEDQLKAVISGLSLEDAVSLEGYQTDVTPYYREAALLLLTSSHEGFCLAVAEAKTCGLPCVSYELPYLCFAENPRGFFTAPQGDAAAAAKQVVRLLQDPALLTKARRDALDSAEDFSEDRLTGGWLQIFRQLESIPDGEKPIPDPDAVVIDTLLSHAHMGLTKLKQQADQWRRDAAGGLLSSIFDAGYYADRYPDLRQAFGTDSNRLLNHFLEFGMSEGRQACEMFDPHIYQNRYEDLRNAFGDNLKAYYLHFLLNGRSEGRTAI